VSKSSNLDGQSGSSTNSNSSIVVEEEPSTWLGDWGVQVNGVTLY